MKGELPDLNLLLALAWPNHQFHLRARRWFAGERTGNWFTCWITQLGFVRLSSNPAFTVHAKTPLEATRLLAAMVSDADHRYLGAAPELVAGRFERLAPRLAGHRQVTDGCLLSIAAEGELCLVTFDRRLEALAPEPRLVRLLPL